MALIKQDIQLRTREDLDKQQKEYFLQQQIKNIQDELGTGQDEEVENLRDKDAYNLLDTYLKNLRYHSRKEEGADEIIADM